MNDLLGVIDADVVLAGAELIFKLLHLFRSLLDLTDLLDRLDLLDLLLVDCDLLFLFFFFSNIL